MTILEALSAHAAPLCIAVPLLGAFLTPLLGRLGARFRGLWAMAVLLVTAGFLYLLAAQVLSTGPQLYVFGSTDLSTPMVRILFEVDAVSVLMAVVTTLLALVAVVYSYGSMKGSDGHDKYYTLLLLLVASTLGMELTGDLFNFFVFFEISVLASTALIAFWVFEGESVEAAFKYMVLSSIGALFFLLAIGLLYAQYNALNIAAIASVLTLSFLDKIALVLLVVVLAMKAGLAPMHMWLPDAYGRAPPSVTVAIIAATLASFYGILRVVFTLYGGTLAEPLKVSVPLSVILGALLMVLAMATIVVGVLMALVQTDLMRVIGYAAVAELGYIFLAVGAGLGGMGTALADTSRTALAGGLFHVFNDALDISLLFLVAGSVFYATKRRSLDELGGLARTMKWTTVFFLVGLLAVSGMPPLNGFSSKLLIYESVYQLNPILSIVAILGSILLLAVFVKVLYAVFLGPEVPDLRQTREVPRSMLAAMGIVASLAVVVGLFPTLVLDTLVTPAVDALLDSAQYLAAVGVV